MSKSKQYYIRKSHRILGVLLGIQFMLWTIGGLYFSWNNIDEVHGDMLRKRVPLLSSGIQLVSPTIALEAIKKNHKIDSLVSIQLIDILGKPFYQIRCVSALHDMGTHTNHAQLMNHLADAQTGNLRAPLTKDEAVAVAKRHFAEDARVVKVEKVDSINPHHEYRSASRADSVRALSDSIRSSRRPRDNSYHRADRAPRTSAAAGSSCPLRA